MSKMRAIGAGCGVMAAAERRRVPRAAERIALDISDAGAEVRTETKNLSAAGAYCQLDRFIPPMSVLELRFELPGSPRRVRIGCRGVVVRVEPIVASGQTLGYNTALFFTEISDRDRAAISRFVGQRLAATAGTGD